MDATTDTGDPAQGPAEPSRSRLSAAVAQLTSAVSHWYADLADLAEHQADRVSSGNYRANDLVSGQVGIARLWIRNAVKTSFALSDNLALLACPPSDRPAGFGEVLVQVPGTHTTSQLSASELVGVVRHHCVRSSKVTLCAEPPTDAGTTVRVSVDFTGAPNDTYQGCLTTADGGVSQPFMLALSEVGAPAES